MSQQPKWKFLANLGDVNPVDHNGYFVFQDETGVYEEEAEFLIAEDTRWIAYRFILGKCTYGKVVNGDWTPLDHYDPDGVLSDNPYHPDHPAWFAQPESEKEKRPQDNTYLSNIANVNDGVEIWDLIQMFCSEDPIQRAFAYEMVGHYHGFENLDAYALWENTRDEVEKRYEKYL